MTASSLVLDLGICVRTGTAKAAHVLGHIWNETAAKPSKEAICPCVHNPLTQTINATSYAFLQVQQRRSLPETMAIRREGAVLRLRDQPVDNAGRDGMLWDLNGVGRAVVTERLAKLRRVWSSDAESADAIVDLLVSRTGTVGPAMIL